MKALKYLLAGFAALMAMAAVVAGIVAITFDPNEYKPQIVEFVKEKYGRTLTIDGDIGLRLFPRVGGSVKGATLSEPGSDTVFAKFAEASISVALLPLVQRKVVVDRVELVGLDANLVRRKDGAANFDDLAGKGGEPAPKPGKAPAAVPLEIDISGVSVRSGAIGWRDEADGTSVRLTGVDLSTGRITSGVPGRLTFRGRVLGEKPRVNAEVKLSVGYLVDFRTTAVKLDGLDAEVQGDVAGMKGLKAALAGDIAWAGGNRLDIANVRLDASDKEGLEAKLSAPRLTISPERSESSPIEATVKVTKGPRRTDARISLAAVKSTGKRVDFSSLGLQLDMKQGDLTVQGRIATPVTLDLDKSQASLPQVAGQLTVSGPDIPNKSLQVAVNGNAQSNWAKKEMNADLAAKFDDSNAKLKVSYTELLRFDFVVDRLDLDRYRGRGTPAAAPKGDGKAGKPAQPAKDEPIDLSPLQGLNGTGNLRFGSLVASGVRAQSVHVGVKAADGRVDLNPVTAQLYQGTASGAVSVNANSNQFAVRQQLTNVAIGPLLRDAAGKDILEGRGNVALDVITSGNTTAALKRGLNGKASLNLRDGSIKGVDLGALARRVRSLRSGESTAAARTEKTDFTELSASFVIRNGVAHNEDLVTKSPFVRIAGAGDVDIGAGSLDYLVKASIVATSTGQEGKAAADVRGLTFPVKLTGPFDDLKYSVDARGLATEAARDEIRKRLEERVSKGGLGDALKGILGR